MRRTGTSRITSATLAATGAVVLLALTGCDSTSPTAASTSPVSPKADVTLVRMMGVEDYPVTNAESDRPGDWPQRQWRREVA